MSARQSRWDQKERKSQKIDKDESIDDILANVDKFVEGVYRDLSISPPRRFTTANVSSLKEDESSSRSAESPQDVLATPSRNEISRFFSPATRRNMDAEIDKINQICENVDQNLRSIGVFMNDSSAINSENLTNRTSIDNNTNPTFSSPTHGSKMQTNSQETGSSSMEAESIVDLSNSEVPQLLSRPVVSFLNCDNDATVDITAEVNHFCDSVDQILRSNDVSINDSSPIDISENLSNTNLNNSPSSMSVIIVDNTSSTFPSPIHGMGIHPQGCGSSAREPTANVIVDLSNLETPEPVVSSRNYNNDDNDDVILVSATIPSIDLCTPNGYQEITRPINHQNLSRRRINRNNNNEYDEDCNCSCGTFAIKRNCKPLHKQLKTISPPLINKPASVTIDDGRTPFMCAVCMESCLQRQPTSTICGHIFCKVCIQKAIALTRKCPLCNKKITSKQTFRIYF